MTTYGMTDQALVNEILNGLLVPSTAMPTTTQPLYLRLLATVGTNQTDGTEITGATGYTAGGNNMGTPPFSVANSGHSVNQVTVEWTAGNSWPTINGVEIWDSSSTKQRLFQAALATAITGVASGDILEFAQESIEVDASQW